MFGFSRRSKQVVVTVVYDRGRDAFFLVYNPRWRRYALPTRRWDGEGVADPLRYKTLCEATALRALTEDLGRVLPDDAEAVWMEHLEVEGRSGRTGDPARYVYDVVTVDPKVPLPAGEFGGLCGFQTWAQIRSSPLVTWTTQEALEKLLNDQHAAVAVIGRRGRGGREFLMTLNRYGQFFFPAKRLRTYETPGKAVVAEFKIDANFLGRIDVRDDKTVTLEQETRHLGPRRYLFHLCPTTFPGIDLAAPNNALEDALNKAEKRCRWVTEDEVRNPPDWLSHTVTGLRDAILALPV